MASAQEAVQVWQGALKLCGPATDVSLLLALDAAVQQPRSVRGKGD
jgi:hypothetical protein